MRLAPVMGNQTTVESTSQERIGPPLMNVPIPIKPLLTLSTSGIGVPFDSIEYTYYNSAIHLLTLHLKHSKEKLDLQCPPDKYQLVLDHWSAWLARK